MIKLLTTAAMFPVRLVAIRSTDGKELPPLIEDATEEDHAHSRKKKESIPDYMNGISTGECSKEVRMAKYKLQIAEQRKKILSRERRNQERTRLNQRADVVNKRERTIFEKRIIELNNACDDVEDGKYIQSERESVHRVYGKHCR